MEARRYLGKTQIDRWKLLARNRREDSSLMDICEAPVARVSPQALVHQVSDWCSGAAANFDWMREAKRENTRCGL